MKDAARLTPTADAGIALAGCASQSAARRYGASLGAPAVRVVELPGPHGVVAVAITAPPRSGTVVAGSERLRLEAAHAVGLTPAVDPDSGTDRVLLVHHLGRGEEHHP